MSFSAVSSERDKPSSVAACSREPRVILLQGGRYLREIVRKDVPEFHRRSRWFALPMQVMRQLYSS